MPVDPAALATWANGITVGRLMLSPLMFLVIPEHDRGAWVAFALWFALSMSDGFDGVIARRHGTTRSGAFLDPLADKVLVLGAMMALVASGSFWWLPVGLIAVRELTVSLYRSYAARSGISVPARGWAKVKTVCQEFAVAAALFPPTAADAHWLAVVLLWVAVVLTTATGVAYLLDGRRLARAL